MNLGGSYDQTVNAGEILQRLAGVKVQHGRSKKAPDIGGLLACRFSFLRGVTQLFLPDSKSGRKTVILNAPALTLLNGLQQIGPYVVPGDNPDSPRPDLKRPWEAITKR